MMRPAEALLILIILLGQRTAFELKNQFGRRTVTELVSGERDQLMRDMRDNLVISVSDLGIEIIDFRVKRIDLPPELSNSVYERMRSERNRWQKNCGLKGTSSLMKSIYCRQAKGYSSWQRPIKPLKKFEVRAMQQHQLFMQNLSLKILNFMSSPEV